MIDLYKTCTRCKRKLTTDMFYVRTNSFDGRQSNCKDCRSVYQKLTKSSLNPHIVKNAIGSYLEIVGKYPLLTQAQEVELATKVKSGDAEARDLLVLHNLRLVYSIANRYAHGTNLPIEDIISEGTIGLVAAVDKFDHLKGYKFSTYATWWIERDIARAVSYYGKGVRIPAHVSIIINRLRKRAAEIEQETGERPGWEEVCEEMTEDKHILELAIKWIDDMESFDYNDELMHGSVTDAHSCHESDLVTHVLSGLTNEERTIIGYRFGLNNTVPKTLEEIAEIIEMSTEGVRQIEDKVMKKLRKRRVLKAFRE